MTEYDAQQHTPFESLSGEFLVKIGQPDDAL